VDAERRNWGGGMSSRRLIVIGGGNMGGAILRGAIAAGVVWAERAAVAEPEGGKRAEFAAAGIAVFEKAAEAAEMVGPGDLMLVAVKPQYFADVAPAIHEGASRGGVVVSIMAGVTVRRLREAASDSSRVVRVMPNLPASIGAGMTAIARPQAGALTAEELGAVKAVFEAVGRVCEIDEAMMNAFTAVGGSGPAYLFYLAEGMEKGACELGFSAAEARVIVGQTLLGAARLLGESGTEPGVDRGPGALRESVTSRGGTTAAAVGVLDENRVLNVICAAIAAARARGEEIGKV